MREGLRGALLSVLFLSGLALFTGPLAAQNSDPSGNTTCDDNGNCASNGNDVDAGNNGSGTPGATNPTAPGSGSGYGGMGGMAPDVPLNGISSNCSYELGGCVDEEAAKKNRKRIAELRNTLCGIATAGEESAQRAAEIAAILSELRKIKGGAIVAAIFSVAWDTIVALCGG